MRNFGGKASSLNPQRTHTFEKLFLTLKRWKRNCFGAFNIYNSKGVSIRSQSLWCSNIYRVLNSHLSSDCQVYYKVDLCVCSIRFCTMPSALKASCILPSSYLKLRSKCSEPRLRETCLFERPPSACFIAFH